MRIKYLIILIFSLNVSAEFLETKWTVTDHVGDLWYAKKENLIGKNQIFDGGYAEGVFYSCDFAGQSMTYNTYKFKDILKNKELSQKGNLEKVLDKNYLNSEGQVFFVHRITCNGKSISDRKVMYPFITAKNSNKGFYLYEGAIITLEYN
mgnify:FL=1